MDTLARPEVPAPVDDPLQAEAARLAAEYGHLSDMALLEPLLTGSLKRRIALVSSFGTEAAVLLHMVAQIDPTTPVIFLNTLKLFGETLRYRDRLVAQLGLTALREVKPIPQDEQRLDPDGVLWMRDTNACCYFRKTLPLERALLPFDAWITGRKRFQAATRAALPAIEFVEGKIKLNPLADWSRDRLEAYMDAHGLPRHPLEADGFLSIGCMPCTDRVAPGEDARAGRWRGQNKIECGIHLSPIPRKAVPFQGDAI